MKKRNDLQWLRAIAVSAVVGFHLIPEKFLLGYLGVDIYQSSKEFKVELKDVKVSYFYYGFGECSCANGKDVLIATMSRPNATHLRQAVRDSWAKNLPDTFSHKFFIGSTQNKILRNSLDAEARHFGDIVFTNLTDSYLNLTLKMSSVFQWQQFYCPKVKYLLRSDVDTILDAERFEYWLNKEIKNISKSLNEMAIFGHLNHNFTIFRDPKGKWYVPYEAYNGTYYPDYTNGPSYLLTSKSVQLILKEAKNHKFMAVDDALYTGFIAEAAGITRINAEKHFAFGNPLNGWNGECDENGIPYLFSIYDEGGEIENVPGGYDEHLKKLKKLNCSNSKRIL